MVEVNHAHERELVHLVAERDRAQEGKDEDEVKRIEARIKERYGYLTLRPEQAPGFNHPRILKA